MAADATKADVERVRIVEFRLGRERYGIGVGDVRGMVKMERSTRVPRAPESIDGVIDIRGEITAILDPRVHLDVPEPAAAPEDQRVLILDHGSDTGAVGLRVDRVVGVQEVEVNALSAADSVEELPAQAVERGLITAVLPLEDDSDAEFISILDVDSLLDVSTPEIDPR